MSARSDLIHKAASLPVGNPERRTLLARLAAAVDLKTYEILLAKEIGRRFNLKVGDIGEVWVAFAKDHEIHFQGPGYTSRKGEVIIADSWGDPVTEVPLTWDFRRDVASISRAIQKAGVA